MRSGYDALSRKQDAAVRDPDLVRLRATIARATDILKTAR